VKIIDIDHWERKSHFDFFSGMDYPQLNICFDIDITSTRNFAKENGYKFFNLLLYLSSYAANQIPEMRTRLSWGRFYDQNN
jgi:chloramphenicol O-acetyltransferase type A